MTTPIETPKNPKNPKIIFIIPYRNRIQQKHFFNIYIQHILEDYPENYAKVFFVEQNEQHAQFNRGAVKNIGFMALREKYPNDYKNITFVFNDVDTVPYKKNILNYETTIGTIKHFYGKRFALGGIFSITGADFERIGGFPNYWTWGHEDVVIVKRAEQQKHGIRIDRTNFFELGDPNIIQLNDEKTRNVDISTSFVDEDPLNTMKIIMNLKFSIIDNETFHSNIVYIEHFDLALTKVIHNYVIDLKKGEEHHKNNFGKAKENYKKIYGERKKYFINESVDGAREHLLANGYDLSLLMTTETKRNSDNNSNNSNNNSNNKLSNHNRGSLSHSQPLSSFRFYTKNPNQNLNPFFKKQR